MSMDLKTALERVEQIRVEAAKSGDDGHHEAELDARALRLVLQCARENHAAKLVAEVNVTTARALAAAEGAPGANCRNCGGPTELVALCLKCDVDDP